MAVETLVAPLARGHYARQARANRVRAGAVVGAGWLVLAMSVVLFLAEDGLGRFSDLGSSVNALGIIAGLIATSALLLMLLLAARVPLIDRALGQPRATALHSQLGDTVVIGLGLHAVLVLVGYAAMDAISIIDEFVYLWAQSDFILAVVAMALLVAVVVSSIAAARRRLPYEVWHAVHLASYVAVGLSIPHMFSMSGLLAQGAWQRSYWIALLVVTGGCLLAFRCLRPAWVSLRHRVRVTAVTSAGPNVFHIEVSGRRLDRLGVQAGQYLHWRFLAPGLWWHQHPFSVSAAPSAARLRITVRVLGAGTAALRDLRVGTKVFIEGPYGTFTDGARTTDAVTLVGAGAGIAPIRTILESTAFDPGAATVVLRGSRADDVVLGEEVAALCDRRGARLVELVGHRAPDDRWVPADQPGLTLVDVVPGVAGTDLYVCGPEGFMASVLADARAAGVPEERIHTEAFGFAA